jgi:hypothetical protein
MCAARTPRTVVIYNIYSGSHGYRGVSTAVFREGTRPEYSSQIGVSDVGFSTIVQNNSGQQYK